MKWQPAASPPFSRQHFLHEPFRPFQAWWDSHVTHTEILDVAFRLFHCGEITFPPFASGKTKAGAASVIVDQSLHTYRHTHWTVSLSDRVTHPVSLWSRLSWLSSVTLSRAHSDKGHSLSTHNDRMDVSYLYLTLVLISPGGPRGPWKTRATCLNINSSTLMRRLYFLDLFNYELEC